MLICLKYENKKKERQQKAPKPSTTDRIFSGTNFLLTINQNGKENRGVRKDPTTPELLTVFPSTAYGNSNTGRGGVGGHLRRISETGKVTKLSLE